MKTVLLITLLLCSFSTEGFSAQKMKNSKKRFKNLPKEEGQAPQPVPQPVQEVVIQPVFESPAPVLQPVPQPVQEVVIQPVFESPAPVLQPVPQPVQEVVIQPVFESPAPVLQPVFQPVQEVVIQPVFESPAPVLQPVPQPVQEVVIQPVFESPAPVLQPVFQPVQEVVIQPVFESPAPVLQPVFQPVQEVVIQPVIEPPAPVLQPVPQPVQEVVIQPVFESPAPIFQPVEEVVAQEEVWVLPIFDEVENIAEASPELESVDEPALVTHYTQREIQAAIDLIFDQGGGAVELPEGEYEIRNTVYLRDQISLVGKGTETILKKCPEFMVSIVADVAQGDVEIYVDDTSGFQEGDGATIFFDGVAFPIVAEVAGKTGDSLVLKDPIAQMISLEARPRVVTFFPMISCVSCNGSSIEQLVIDGSAQDNRSEGDSWNIGVNVSDSQFVAIRNVAVYHSSGDGILLNNTTSCLCENTVVQHSNGAGITIKNWGAGNKFIGNLVSQNNIGVSFCVTEGVKTGAIVFLHNTFSDNVIADVEPEAPVENVFMDNWPEN